MAISGVNSYGSIYVGSTTKLNQTSQASKAEKPVWNGKKAYKYLEDSNDAMLEYGAKATRYYASKTMEDGEMSIADLKKQIGEMFSDYTFTDHEPKDVAKGKHYLYIDSSQLKKMAEDPGYRAKVYGLMDREMETGKEFTYQYSDGKNVTQHIIGSIFSLSEANRKYAGADGVPYRGSGMSDHPWSSSESHVQVRNQSFLYDNLDPAKSAKKSRATAAKIASMKHRGGPTEQEKVSRKRAEKKQAEKKAEEKKEKIKREEAAAEKRKLEKEQLEKHIDFTA